MHEYRFLVFLDFEHTLAYFGTRVDAFCERFTHSNIYMNVVLTHITVKLSIFTVTRHTGS